MGGSKYLVAAADEKGRVLQRVQHPTPDDLDEGLELLHAMIAEVASGRDVAGIGAAIGGPLDWENGIVSPLHQPQWRNVPLKEIMQDRWFCPFAVDVDTNIAALGEWHYGKHTARRLLYLTVSTGMGGGMLEEGCIIRGSGGVHPEAGHQAINYICSGKGIITCECGAEDCLEAFVSGNGIQRVYNKTADKLNSDEWEEVAHNLGQGMRNLAALTVPDLIVLGGGVAWGGGKTFIDKAREVMTKGLFIVPVPEVKLSDLGYDTALKGAIAAAIHGIK